MYIYMYVRHILNYQTRGRTKQFFPLSDQKICAKHQGNICGFSMQRELYNTVSYLALS